MNAIKVLVCVALLTGCAQDPRIVAFEAGQRKVNLDKRVLMECSDLVKLKSSTEEERLKADEQWTAAYKECRSWKRALNEIVKDAFNTNKPEKEAK